jgi:hypothetical protein
MFGCHAERSGAATRVAQLSIQYTSPSSRGAGFALAAGSDVE